MPFNVGMVRRPDGTTRIFGTTCSTREEFEEAFKDIRTMRGGDGEEVVDFHSFEGYVPEILRQLWDMNAGLELGPILVKINAMGR